MKIKFIGAVGGDVTGSCILCCARNGTRFLVDCGMYQGGKSADTKNIRFPFDPKSIDFVLLTHAHIDHCGRIPYLYACGFTGKIVCNNATRDLAILNMTDMLMNGNSSLDLKNIVAKNESEWKALFITEDNMPSINNAVFYFDYDLQISMFRSSHFLGSTSFSVGWNIYKPSEGAHEVKTICFSGDLGSVIDNDTNHLTLLKDGFAPWVATDYIVMESTYGARVREPKHKCFSSRIKHLEELILADDIDTFVFACFSMQRTQDILFDLLYITMQNKKYDFTVNLDSSMGIGACSIFKRALKSLKIDRKNGKEKFIYLNENFVKRFLPLLGNSYIENISGDGDKEIHAIRKFIIDVLSVRFKFNNVSIKGRYVDDEEHEEPSTKPPRKEIHITSSGMFHSGPILNHIKERHSDKHTAFFITGFCKTTETGKILSAWGEGDDLGGIITVHGERIDRTKWRAKIHDVSQYYSGHADAEGLLRFLFYSEKYGEGQDLEGNNKEIVNDKRRVTVFLNHGDTPARIELKKKIEIESKKPENQQVREIKNVLMPNATDPFFDLDKGEWDTIPNDILSPFFTVPTEKEPEKKKKSKKKKVS